MVVDVWLVIVLLTCGFDLKWLSFFEFSSLLLIFTWYLYVDFGMWCWYWIECPFDFDYLFFLNSLCYPWGRIDHQDSFPRIVLWFDYLYVDYSLSSLQGGSGSLTRWPRSREVVTSYHLGPPQIDRCWMSVDAVVPLSLLFLSQRLLFGWFIYVIMYLIFWYTCIYFRIPCDMCSAYCSLNAFHCTNYIDAFSHETMYLFFLMIMNTILEI